VPHFYLSHFHKPFLLHFQCNAPKHALLNYRIRCHAHLTNKTGDCVPFVVHRLDNFVVGLTNDDPATTAPVFKSSYTLCGQYSGRVAAGDDAAVPCAPSGQFRYVIVHGALDTHAAMCLMEVAVYARSKCQLRLVTPTSCCIICIECVSASLVQLCCTRRIKIVAFLHTYCWPVWLMSRILTDLTATPYVDWNLGNCCTAKGIGCTTNPEEIEVMELERYGWPTCSKQPRRVDRRSRGQGPPSTSFVDNTIDLLWRNFVSPEFGIKFQRELPLFLEIPELP